MLPELINFLSNNFDILLIINFALLVVFITIRILLSVRDLRVGDVLIFFDRAFFYFIVAAEVCMILVSGYIYWINYQQRSQNTLPDVLKDSTHWVRDRVTIYYIRENVLWSVESSGRYSAKVYEAQSNITGYHFSPNGKEMLIVSENDLVLLNRKANKKTIIDSVQLARSDIDFKGSIGNIHWSPDSQKFTYAVSRWSPFSSQDNTYIYFLDEKRKVPIKSPTRKIPNLFWDKDGQNVHYLMHTALDPQEHGYPYDVRIFKVPVVDAATAFKPVLLTEISSDEPEVSPDILAVRNIHVYTAADKLSFGLSKKTKLVWISKEGSKVGIDKDDHLYYVPNRWWRKRLFYVSRDPLVGDIRYYQHQETLSIRHLEWLPGGRYIIIGHSSLGILILEPRTGRVGRLAKSTGYSFGWYQSNE